LGLFLATALSFITLEAVSAPPANGPRHFARFVRYHARRRPVLVCLGEGLTHGNCSASITPEIPSSLCQTLGLPPPTEKIFSDPLWVLNCSQNCITTHTILNERLNAALNCHPDYILLCIGTNDMLAIYNKAFAKCITSINELPQDPTMQIFEKNLCGILSFIQKSSPLVQIGVCTLPPMGENLKSAANQVIRQANDIIYKVTSSCEDKVTVVPVYEKFEAILEKKRRGGLPVDLFFPVALFMNPLYHVLPFFTFNMLSAPFGHSLLSDGLHLNENGRDEMVELVVEWLVKKNIAKAIAVKS